PVSVFAALLLYLSFFRALAVLERQLFLNHFRRIGGRNLNTFRHQSSSAFSFRIPATVRLLTRSRSSAALPCAMAAASSALSHSRNSAFSARSFSTCSKRIKFSAAVLPGSASFSRAIIWSLILFIL